jgi:hypothetical protein
MTRLSALSWLIGWWAVAPMAVLAADETAAQGLQAVITTADDEQISAQITALQGGKLSLATEPARTIALVDVQRIEIGKVAAGATSSDLTWIGQDNHDLVQVGGANGGNGIQDLHLHATNLKPAGLKQIVVVSRFPKQLRVWRLDTSGSPHWRVAVARMDRAVETELYLEPPADDSYGQKFEATYTYDDGSTSKASVTATTHTSDQLKVDGAVQPGQVATKSAAAAPSKTQVYLADSGRLQGELAAMNSESLTLRAAWKAEVQVPLLRVTGIWLGNAAPSGARSDFEKQLAAPAGEDVVFLVATDKSAAQVQGNVQGVSDGKLTMRFEGAERSVKQDRVLGIVLAAHPKIPPIITPFQVFLFASGDALSGHWLGVSGGTLEIETLWQLRLTVPAAEVAEIRARNGRVTYLSDLEPLAVEEVPYFGRMIHWRRDQGFDGSPAKVKGKQPARWLAMHSHCVLTYALDGQYEKFKATLGFDDSAGTRGRALCRVVVDGREVFLQDDLRSDQDPQAIEIPLSSAKQMSLEVGFGKDADIGDRIIWAEPRLFRTETR